MFRAASFFIATVFHLSCGKKASVTPKQEGVTEAEAAEAIMQAFIP